MQGPTWLIFRTRFAPAWHSLGEARRLSELAWIRAAGARARIVEVDPFLPPSDGELARWGRARGWILPYGSASTGLVSFALSARRRLLTRPALSAATPGRSATPPILAQLNGEGAKGALLIQSRAADWAPEDRLVVACRAEARALAACFATATGDDASSPARSPGIAVLALPLAPGWWSVARAAGSSREILAVGRLSLQKNPLATAETFRAFLAAQPRAARSRWNLRWIGAADALGVPHLPPALGARLENPVIALARWTSAAGLGDRVRWDGFVARPALMGALDRAAAHLCLSTHWGEDHCYAAAEGLARGCESVLARWGGLADRVGPGAAHVPVRAPAPEQPWARPRIDLAAEALARAVERSRGPGAERRRREIRAYWRSQLSVSAIAAQARAVLDAVPSAAHPGASPPRFSPAARALLTRALERPATGLFPSPTHAAYRRVHRAYALA